jgi:hypothetical protein
MFDLNFPRKPGANNDPAGKVFVTNLGDTAANEVSGQGLLLMASYVRGGAIDLSPLFIVEGAGIEILNNLPSEMHESLHSPYSAVQKYLRRTNDELNANAASRLQALYEGTSNGLPERLITLQETSHTSRPGRVSGAIEVFRQSWMTENGKTNLVSMTSDIILRRYLTIQKSTKLEWLYAKEFPEIDFSQYVSLLP